MGCHDIAILLVVEDILSDDNDMLRLSECIAVFTLCRNRSILDRSSLDRTKLDRTKIALCSHYAAAERDLISYRCLHHVIRGVKSKAGRQRLTVSDPV